MKGKIGWILGTLETTIGFICFLVAQMEISSNSRYTWSQPYTTYEAQVILTRWIGIALMISGICWLCLKIYQTRYTNFHTHDINQLTQQGGTVKCWNCGLVLSVDAKNCPRCGRIVKQKTNNEYVSKNDVAHFCPKCGKQVNIEETFCSKCGQKISNE